MSALPADIFLKNLSKNLTQVDKVLKMPHMNYRGVEELVPVAQRLPDYPKSSTYLDWLDDLRKRVIVWLSAWGGLTS
jgi:hypothetical protein